MSEFVLDAAVTMGWCFAAHADPYCRRVLEALNEDRAIAPEIWLHEVTNVLLVSERRRRLTLGQSDEFLSRLRQFPIEVESVAGKTPWPGEVFRVARAHDLTTYDAAYLELAQRRKLPLATLDTALRSAAHRIGVSLFLDPTD